MKKTFECIGFIIALIIIVAAVLTYLTPHFGWRVDAVLSGSMEPELKVGSLVVTCPAEPEDIEIGDIITFRQATVTNGMASHRVISISKNSPIYFQTKGDANEDPDPYTVYPSYVEGVVKYHIPYLGYFTDFAKTRLGLLLLLVLPGVIIIGVELREIWITLSRAEKSKIEMERKAVGRIEQ